MGDPRPFHFAPSSDCDVCGDSLLYRPVSGWDPTTDDGDNDGWDEDGEPQKWRTDLFADGSQAVCAGSDCRRIGFWSADGDGVSCHIAEDAERMGIEEHAKAVQEARDHG